MSLFYVSHLVFFFFAKKAITIITTKQVLWRLTRVEEDYRTMNSYKDLQDVQSYCFLTDIVQCRTLIFLDTRHLASEFNKVV